MDLEAPVCGMPNLLEKSAEPQADGQNQPGAFLQKMPATGYGGH